MQQGTVELASGRWHWTVQRKLSGATVLYQHRERIYDELRNWTPEVDLTEAQAMELARDPLERMWVDVDGLRWRLTIELPTTWRPGSGAKESDLWLVFRRGGATRFVEIAENQRLGEFSHPQLVKFLNQAFRSAGAARL